MKINELIKSVAHLVSERETIDHGSIRCLHGGEADGGVLNNSSVGH